MFYLLLQIFTVFHLCLLPQARTSDLTYDVGVEVDYFEYILLRGFFY